MYIQSKCTLNVILPFKGGNSIIFCLPFVKRLLSREKCCTQGSKIYLTKLLKGSPVSVSL